MTDEEILENYAIEFFQVLTSYDKTRGYNLEKSIISGRYLILNGFELVFRIWVDSPEKAIVIYNEEKYEVFRDTAPFEHKKEIKA